MADSSNTLGSVATSVTSNLSSVAQLVTASSYLAGLGFSVASIAKFKAHKDNPTQIPVGTPVALTAVSAALLFLPTTLGLAGTDLDAKSAAEASGLTAATVEADAKNAGVTAAKAEAAAETAGATPAEVSAAERTLKAKLSG
jgi:intracellular multiplication protein IcmD